MASAFYTAYRENMLGDGTRVDLETGTIKVRAVNTGTDYTFSAAHTALTSITAYSGTTDPTISTGKTITGGVFDEGASESSVYTFSPGFSRYDTVAQEVFSNWKTSVRDYYDKA